MHLSLQVRSPFPPEFLPLAWDWVEPFWDRVAADGAPRSKQEFVAHQRALSQSPLFKSWGVWRGGELGGLISFERKRETDIAGWRRAFFKRSFFRQQTMKPALMAVYDELFRQGIETIRDEVYQGNHEIRRLARHLGAKEYVVRNAAMKDGMPVNMVGLVLTRERFYAVAGSDPGVSGNGHAWLAPAAVTGLTRRL